MDMPVYCKDATRAEHFSSFASWQRSLVRLFELFRRNHLSNGIFYSPLHDILLSTPQLFLVKKLCFLIWLSFSTKNINCHYHYVLSASASTSGDENVCFETTPVKKEKEK